MRATTEQLLWMYEKMIEIREYEETMARVYLGASSQQRSRRASPSLERHRRGERAGHRPRHGLSPDEALRHCAAESGLAASGP